MSRAKGASKIIKRVRLREGGATSPTVEFYQRASGRCRLFWYAFDQDGSQSETLATFIQRDWEKAKTTAIKVMENGE